jgi:uncharacterized membrane protein
MEFELGMGISQAYGHWKLVLFNIVLWSLPVFFWVRPRKPREMLAFGLFSLFLIDVFVELYGFPYTLMLFADEAATYGVDGGLSFRAGDLWRIWLKEDDYHHEVYDLYHLFAGIFLFGGLIALFVAARTLRNARLSNVPATTGVYAFFRHPQYLALISVMLGHIIQGPTLPTLVLFPLVSSLYILLAHWEEKDLLTRFGAAYDLYMKRTPGFMFWR